MKGPNYTNWKLPKSLRGVTSGSDTAHASPETPRPLRTILHWRSIHQTLSLGEGISSNHLRSHMKPPYSTFSHLKPEPQVITRTIFFFMGGAFWFLHRFSHSSPAVTYYTHLVWASRVLGLQKWSPCPASEPASFALSVYTNRATDYPERRYQVILLCWVTFGFPRGLWVMCKNEGQGMERWLSG